MLGNLPFFFIIIVIASNTKLIAIINSASMIVLNILFIFVTINATIDRVCLCSDANICQLSARLKFSSVKKVKKRIDKVLFNIFLEIKKAINKFKLLKYGKNAFTA